MNTVNTRHLEKALDILLEQIQPSFDLPGFAVGVVRENEILYAKGFGVRDVRTQEPVTPRSMFHQASISKLVTAAAAVQLVERDLVHLDEPITTYLPAFRLSGDGWQTITVEHLLTHTAGLPDVEDHDWANPEYDQEALKRYVVGLDTLALDSEPGEAFAYSSLGFNLLGALIAEVSGETFEAYVQHQLFDPLGMHDSTFLKPEVPPELATSPHIRTPRMAVSHVFPYSRPQAPSGALQSSAADMCRWALAFLQGGAPSNDQNTTTGILSPQSRQRMWQPRAHTGSISDPRQSKIGLGWFLGEYRGVPVAMHDGGDVGYEAELTLLPEQSAGVAVMANVFPAVTDAITRAVLDVLLGFGLQTPSPPRMVSVISTLRDSGLEAAAARYRQPAQDAGDADESYLRNSIFILQEAHRLEDAAVLMELAARKNTG